eukprot:gene38467-46754_t
MGNSVDSKFLPQQEHQELAFFQSLSAPWLDFIVAQLHSKTGLQPSLKRVNLLRWKDYFGVFKTLRSSVTQQNETLQRAHYHPAAHGYHMQRTEVVAEEAEAAVNEVKRLIDDDFTNDEASDASSESSETPSDSQGNLGPSASVVRNRPPRHLDTQYVSPIFFGYSVQRSAAQASQAATAEQQAAEREQRALGKAIQARSVLVDALEKKAQQQHGARQRRLDEL